MEKIFSIKNEQGYSIYRGDSLVVSLNRKSNAELILAILNLDSENINYKDKYIITRFTKIINDDFKKCEEHDYEGDCSDCACNVCLMQ